MKGLTNATNTSNDAKGDVVYAVNNTGGDILAQQKVWLNKHNNTDLESSWISGGYSSYISGFALFFNANNNFLALSRAATAFYALYDNDDKTWTLNTVSVTPSVLNNLVAYNNFIEAENCYYGFYINNTAVKSMASATVDGNFTVKTYEDEIVLSEQWAFKKTDTDYVFEVVDRINTSRPHISFNFSEYQENIYTVLLDNDNEFLFITKSEIDNEVRFRKTEICWNKTDWLLLTPLGKYPRVEPYITQPTIKYFTGIDNGDYLITTSSVIDDSWNKRYNLIIYKITNDGVVIAQDLPTDLHNLIDKPCLVRYDKRTKRLYISNDADFYMFSDQDDFWKKDKVTKTVDFMQTFDYKNQPIAVYTNLQVVDDKLIGDKALLNHNWQDFLALLFTNNAYGCTMMINNQLKKLINFKKLNFQNIYMHDWWLVLVAAAFGKVGYLDQKTILYRQHGDNQVGASEKSIFSYLYRVLNPRRDRTALKRTIGLATEFNNEYYDANLDKLIKKYLQGYGTLYKKSSFFNNLKLVSEYPPHSVYFLKKLYYGYIITFFYSDYKKG